MSQATLQSDETFLDDPNPNRILDTIAANNSGLYRAMLLCAVPHWFDTYVLREMIQEDGKSEVPVDLLLAQMSDMRFFQTNPYRGWQFSDTYRQCLLDRPEVREHWGELHNRAASIFEKMMGLQDLHDLPWEKRITDQDWKNLETERVYHVLCVDPGLGMQTIIEDCAKALSVFSDVHAEVVFCYELILGIDWPSEMGTHEGQKKWLQDGINALMAYRDRPALEMLLTMADLPVLDDKEKASLHYWVGSDYLRDTLQIASAQQQLEKACALDSTMALFQSEAAFSYFSQDLLVDRLDLAGQYAGRSISLAPQSATGYVARGMICQVQEDIDGAISWFHKAIEVDPENTYPRWYLADALALNNKVQDAIEVLDKIVEMDPKQNWSVSERKGYVYLNSRHYQPAIDFFKKVIQDGPEDAEGYLGLGYVYIATGRSDLAEENYRIAIDKEPDNPSCCEALARLYERQGKLNKALAECLGALERGLRSKDLYFALIDIYTDLGREEEARKAQMDLIAYDPAEIISQRCAEGDTLLVKAVLRPAIREENLRRAEDAYRLVVKENPYQALGYVSLASLGVLLKDAQMVAEQRHLLAERMPWAEYSALVRLAAMYMEIDDYEQAERLLREAIAMAPARSGAWLKLRDLFSWAGNFAGLEEIEQALDKINPILAYDTRIIEGDTAFNLLDYSRSRAVYQAAAQYAVERGIEYNQATIELNLADIENSIGNSQDAIAGFQRTAALSPDLAPLAYARIAAVYRIDGDYSRAYENANRAIELDKEKIEGYLELAYNSIVNRDQKLMNQVSRNLSAVAGDRLYDFRLALANFYLETMRNPKKSQDLYSDCHSTRSDQVEPLIGLARVAMRRKLRSAAQEYLDQALALNYSHVEANRVLTDLYLQQGLTDQVLNLQERIMKYAPKEQFNGWISIGKAYEKAKNFSNAEKYYRLAADHFPYRVEAFTSLAQVLKKLGRLEETRRVCQQASLLVGGYLNLGYYFVQERRFDFAHLVYHFGIEEAPPENRPELFIAAANLHMLKRKNAQQAIDEIDNVIKDYPQSPDGYIARSQIEAQLNDPQGAEQWLLDGLEKADNKAMIYWYLGQMKESAKDLDGAIEKYQLSVNEKPGSEIESNITEHLGDLLLQKQEYEKAEAILLQSVQQNPNNAVAYYRLGVSYSNMGKEDEALEMIQNATRISPDYAEALLNQGVLLLQKGSLQEAADAFRRVITLQRNAFAYGSLGKIYLQLQQYDQAAEMLKMAVQIDPHDSEACYYLGMISEVTLDLKQATLDYRRALQINPVSMDIVYALARTYGKMGNRPGLARLAKGIQKLEVGQPVFYDYIRAEIYKSAGISGMSERAYRSAINDFPENIDSYIYLAQLLRSQFKYAEAAGVLESIKGKCEPNYDFLMLQADILGSLHRFSEAVQTCRRATEMEPEEFAGNALIQWGELLLAQNLPDLCIERLQRGKVVTPEAASRVHCTIGKAYAQKNDLVSAEANFVKAIESDRNNAEAYANLGNIKASHDQLSEAESNFRKAIEIDPRNGDIYLALARIYGKQQNVKALSELEDVILRVDPKYQYEAYLVIAASYHEAINYDELAIDQLNKAIKLDPKRSEAYYQLGQMYEKQERWSRACEAFLKAGEMSQEKLPIYFIQAGKMYCKEGDFTAAEKVYRQAIQAAPKVLDGYRTLGEFYTDRQNWDAAIATYRQSMKLDLENASSGYLYLASVYRRLGDQKNMLKVCHRLVARIKAVESPSPVLARRCGLAYLVCGEFPAALQYLSAAAERDTTDVQAAFYLAIVLLGLGRQDEAQKAFDRGALLAKDKGILTYPIEEAEAITWRKPEVAGAQMMYKELLKIRDQLPE